MWAVDLLVAPHLAVVVDSFMADYNTKVLFALAYYVLLLHELLSVSEFYIWCSSIVPFPGTVHQPLQSRGSCLAFPLIHLCPPPCCALLLAVSPVNLHLQLDRRHLR